MAQQDDDELLDEQLMLRALLAEAEDPAEHQQEFTETSFEPATMPVESPTPIYEENTEPLTNTTKTSPPSVGRSKPLEKPKLPARVVSADSLADLQTNTSNKNRTDQVNIKLEFSLGDCHLKHHELASLKPGHIFNLGKTFASPISLYSHSTLLGTAEIVDIEGSVGIRIVALTNK